MRLENTYPANGEEKDQTRNNCSGKHSGFLAVARKLGDDPADYLSPDSKTQRLVRKKLSDVLEFDADNAPMGIDGCSAPNYALPLKNLALGFLRLATAVDGPLARIASAMRAFPEMVSGEKRFDLALARAFANNAVSLTSSNVWVPPLTIPEALNRCQPMELFTGWLTSPSFRLKAASTSSGKGSPRRFKRPR